MKKLAGHPDPTISETYKELAAYAEGIEKDRYGCGDFLNDFEKELAEKIGMEAAIFLPSGVMAQLIAIKIWGDEVQNNMFACHESCHLIRHEEDSYKTLLNFEAILVGKKEAVPKASDLVPNVSSLVYEIPMRHLGGDLPSFEELEKIKSYCQKNKIKLHIDGARIFETEKFYNRSVKEIVAGADSMFISFYKGFGSTSGSMLFGNSEFIAKAKVWLRRFGGNLFQLYPLAIPAKMNFDKRIEKFPSWVDKAKEIGIMLKEDLGIDVKPYPIKTNMMHIHVPMHPEKLNEYFKQYKDSSIRLGVWLEEPKEHSRCEFTVGEGTLEYSLEEIKKIFVDIQDT